MAMNARQAALNILDKCFSGGSLSAQLEELSRSGALKSEDCSLASNIAIGVVQNYRLLDYYISAYSKIPPKKIHPRVRQILRSGIYQLLFLDRIPDFAAIKESADLCTGSIAHTRGFVNAVLRNVSANKERLPELKAGTGEQLLALKYSQPDFLVRMLVGEYGADKAERILAANNEKPELSVFVNTLKISPEEYAERLKASGIENVRQGIYPEGFILPSVSPAELPGYAEGQFYVQDPSAHFLSTVFRGKTDMKILDCCSAPGGKSISAAMSCGGRCRILSCDVSDKKTALIKQNAGRLGLSCIDTEVRDASVFAPELEKSFDAVIADVPCSGLGIIRKHPEIRLKTEESISALPALQDAILANAGRYVKPGGLLIYSTCSVAPAENRERVSAFLKENKDFHPVEHEYGGLRLENGCITFLPGINEGDGFFTAVMQRNM